MSFKSLLSTMQRLTISMEAMAAVLAELKLRQSGVPGDPVFRASLMEMIDKLEPGLLDGLTKDQEALVLSVNTAYFRQAFDLLENPGSEPGWYFHDPEILQAYGVLSKSVVRTINTLAPECPAFDQALRNSGTFVDLGTGVAGLAIEAARTWPSLKVLGIDSWEPALALARQNVAEAGLEDRVELRQQRLEEMPDGDAFSVMFLAGPFFSQGVMDGGIQKILNALRPGGWIVFGLFAPPADPFDRAVAALKTARRGGHPWTTEEVETGLREAGFQEVRSFTPVNQMWLVIGQRGQ